MEKENKIYLKYRKVINKLRRQRILHTSGNWPFETTNKFCKSPWAAASLSKADRSLEASPIAVDDEAVNINLLNNGDCTVFSCLPLLLFSRLSCWSCFPATKIAWMTAMNCNVQSSKTIRTLTIVNRYIWCCQWVWISPNSFRQQAWTRIWVCWAPGLDKDPCWVQNS